LNNPFKQLNNPFKLCPWQHTHKKNPSTTLRKTHGNPTYNDIQHLYKQVKANAASVPSTLGGGQHGHLGLTTNTTTYARIASTPYVRPAAPAPLGPNNLGTAAQINENRRTYNLAVASYHQANLIEKTILNQIQEALDESVLMPLLHDDTGIIKSTIPDVFQYLFDTYGNITDQMIHDERATLLQHQYVHDEPVANIFSKIHKYTTLAEAHGTPETDPQRFILVITRTRSKKVGFYPLFLNSSQISHEKVLTSFQSILISVPWLWHQKTSISHLYNLLDEKESNNSQHLKILSCISCDVT